MSLRSTLALTYLASLVYILLIIILLGSRYTLTYTTLLTYTITLYAITLTYSTCLYTTYVTIRYTLLSLYAYPFIPSSLFILTLTTY
jgi:hypothetical protein